MNFYRIKAEFFLPDEVWNYFASQQKAYENSCFHLLSTEPVTITLPEMANFEEADFYHVHNLIPLFSVRTYQKIRFLIENRSESYHIVKSLTLCYEGRKYQYALLLPVGISCMNTAQKISERKTGYLDLFRNSEDNALYCTEKLHEMMQKCTPFGMRSEMV